MEQAASLLDVLRQGGALMWPLFGLLVVTLVITAERTLTLLLYPKTDTAGSAEKLKTPLSILDLIAMIAPVIGFLGTVTGMITAFRSLSQAAHVELQIVAAGLYEALYTTAFGLIISVAATSCSFLLEMRIEHLCAKEER